MSCLALPTHRPRTRPLAALVLLAIGPLAHAASLTYCADGAPDGFDIAQYETTVTNDASIPVYEQLLALKPGTTEVVPGLADQWQVSADGLQVTLHLRAGVQFHSTPWFKPTREMNADDVLWSINRINDPKHPAHAAAGNGFPYWAGMSMPSLLKSVEKLDAMRVRFTLTRPEAPFIANLTMSALATVFSAEYGEKLQAAGKPGDLNMLPVGTGPYAFKSYQKDAVVRYAPHPGYWGGKPRLDQLIFAVTPDPSVRLQRLKAGECMVGELARQDGKAMAGNPRIATVLSKPLSTTYIAPNSRHKFTGDKRFRQALSLAIDRKAYVQTVSAGYAAPATSFLPPGIWSQDANLVNPHDPEKAKQLLKAAGYDGSELVLFATAKDSSVQRAVELLQADWARVGVKVKVQLMELGELYKRTGQGEQDLALLSWFSDNGDPDNFFTPNLSCAAAEGGGNKSHWCNKAFDSLLDKARTTPDLKQRTALYRQAQKLLHDETGLIPLVNAQEVIAVDKRVKGFEATLFGGRKFNAARVDAAP
ncbi:MAG TPA: ABC transporter substrate-binding protein [Ideonella sp.]|nr:ABC transporter substrate-binding protein [Ideonella sp.]